MVKSPNPQRKKSLLDFRKSNSEGSKPPMEIQFRFYGGKSNFMENIDKISEGNEPQSFPFDESKIEEVWIKNSKVFEESRIIKLVLQTATFNFKKSDNWNNLKKKQYIFQIQRQPSPSHQGRTKLAMSHSVPEFAMTVSHEEGDSVCPIDDQEGIVFGSGSNPYEDIMGRKPSSCESSFSQQSKRLFC